MAAIDIQATKRTVLGKAVANLRAEGQIPGVVYGPKHATESITLNTREFEKVFKAAGESTVVNVVIDGTPVPTLIHEIDHDPITGKIRHADFYAIVKGQKVQVQVPLEFVGESQAVKDGANLVKTMFELEVEADPVNLPHELVVDITKLAVVDDQILASDIVLPAGVTLVGNPEEVIALAAAAVEEDLSVPVTGPDMAEIEASVEKGKKEEEGGEAPEEAKAE